MRLSLSTNWCNRRIESGEEIADKAMELGFEELELGFRTTQEQVKGFKARLDQIPVGSVHAFCPVPISAPQGYPELYSLASFDEEDRRMAKLMIGRNIKFAADMGADTVVLHAGRIGCGNFFDRIDTAKMKEVFKAGGHRTDDPKYARLCTRAARRRQARGRKMLDIFMKELDGLVPVLEKNNVTLALENLPYFEGFPRPDELQTILTRGFGGHVKGWFDTGHARVCAMHGWLSDSSSLIPDHSSYAGMHLNDVEAFDDDHFAPGGGNVDFAALKVFAGSVRHVVFEPNSGVTEPSLRKGVEHIKNIWSI